MYVREMYRFLSKRLISHRTKSYEMAQVRSLYLVFSVCRPLSLPPGSNLCPTFLWCIRALAG